MVVREYDILLLGDKIDAERIMDGGDYVNNSELIDLF